MRLYTVDLFICSILFPYSPVIRDTLSKTNLLVMVDDPIISTNLAEVMLQVQSGLTMGSRNAGAGAPGGSLLLTSNSCVTQRYSFNNVITHWNTTQSLSLSRRVLYNRGAYTINCIGKEKLKHCITQLFRKGLVVLSRQVH